MRQWRPLRGVRVLAFEAAFSLPSGTRLLADMGADVVRVGWPGGTYDNYIAVIDGIGLNKRTIGIDLRNHEGNEIARRLVASTDVVCNNFRPPVMKAYGFDEAALRAIKHDLIVLQLSGYGVPGPWQNFPAYGPSTEAAGGMNASMGTVDDPPMRVGSGVFSDQASGRYAALALISALEHRQRTGEGRTLDLSMYEAIVHLLGNSVLYAARNGTAPPRTGNRDDACVPQGIYPCSGDDNWLALSICDDNQWQVLRELIGSEGLCDPVFDSVESRLAHHDRINLQVAAWTRDRTKEEASALLQGRGIAAGPVQKASDLPFDAQLVAREALQPVTRLAPVLGHTAHPHLTLALRVVGAPGTALAPERPIGKDNRSVLKAWLGVGAAEVTRLERGGALVPVRTSEVRVPPNQLAGTTDPGFARKLDLPLPVGDGDGR